MLLMVGGHPLAHEPAPSVDDARLLFKCGIDFQETIVDWMVLFVENHFDDTITLIHRLKKRTESKFRSPAARAAPPCVR